MSATIVDIRDATGTTFFSKNSAHFEIKLWNTVRTDGFRQFSSRCVDAHISNSTTSQKKLAQDNIVWNKT